MATRTDGPLAKIGKRGGWVSRLAITPDDPALGRVVGGHLGVNLVTGEETAYASSRHPAGWASHHIQPAFELRSGGVVPEDFLPGAPHPDVFVVCHRPGGY